MTQTAKYLIIVAAESALETSSVEATKTTSPTAAGRRTSILAAVMSRMYEMFPPRSPMLRSQVGAPMGAPAM